MKGGKVLNIKKSLYASALIFTLFMSLLTACFVEKGRTDKSAYGDFDAGEGGIPLTSGISASEMVSAEASGLKVKSNDKVLLDYSNTSDGYVMIKYTGANSKVKVQITGPSGTVYTYSQSLTGEYDVYSLSDGNGDYKIGVYENISGSSYSTAFFFPITVALKDEFRPFLISNKYVNYSASGKVVKKAGELCSNIDTTLGKIKAIYEYLVDNFTYDYQLAETVQSGYTPDLDAVLEKGTGICFDYAAVMTAMLRSQGIPTKMVFGYTGSVYHAWISVYSGESGWINAYIYFNGKEWKLMDPTFASNADSSDGIMKYIGNGANYTAKYLY